MVYKEPASLVKSKEILLPEMFQKILRQHLSIADIQDTRKMNLQLIKR